MNTPLVTCLCVTRGRPDWLTRAVRLFESQDYRNAELLVIPDSGDEVSHIETRARFLVAGRPYIDGKPAWEWSLGEKRNFGCDHANGDIIALWDDDDYSAPGRISQQVAELERTGAEVTGYSSMKFTDGWAWWNFNCAPGFVIGSSLCFRRDWWVKHPFPSLQVGEDAAFCEAAHLAGKLAACPDLGLMYASIHPGNTSKRDLTRPPWEALPGFQWPGLQRSKLVL